MHAVRLQGFSTPQRIAARFALDSQAVQEALLDAEALGWVTRSSFADLDGWSLTEAGRVRNEQTIAVKGSARDQLIACFEQFLPLNARFQSAVSDWQIRPLPGDPMAANDHTDFRWDDRVISELASLAIRLRALCAVATAIVPRFAGYDRRFDDALARVQAGGLKWIDGMEVDSLHRVWFEFHEDFLATLGMRREDY